MVSVARNTFTDFSKIPKATSVHRFPIINMSGKYKLENEAVLFYHKNIIKSSETEFEQLWRPFYKLKPHHSRFGSIKRRQGLYQVYKDSPETYTFGNPPQKVVSLGFIQESPTPALVKKCFEHAKRWLRENGYDLKEDGCLITGLHCNWYLDGTSGVGDHADEYYDRCPIILSYGFMEKIGKSEEATRIFHIRKNKSKIAKINMGNGDLVVMSGKNFQKIMCMVCLGKKLNLPGESTLPCVCGPNKRILYKEKVIYARISPLAHSVGTMDLSDERTEENIFPIQISFFSDTVEALEAYGEEHKDGSCRWVF